MRKGCLRTVCVFSYFILFLLPIFHVHGCDYFDQIKRLLQVDPSDVVQKQFKDTAKESFLSSEDYNGLSKDEVVLVACIMRRIYNAAKLFPVEKLEKEVENTSSIDQKPASSKNSADQKPGPSTDTVDQNYVSTGRYISFSKYTHLLEGLEQKQWLWENFHELSEVKDKKIRRKELRSFHRNIAIQRAIRISFRDNKRGLVTERNELIKKNLKQKISSRKQFRKVQLILKEIISTENELKRRQKIVFYGKLKSTKASDSKKGIQVLEKTLKSLTKEFDKELEELSTMAYDEFLSRPYQMYSSIDSMVKYYTDFRKMVRIEMKNDMWFPQRWTYATQDFFVVQRLNWMNVSTFKKVAIVPVGLFALNEISKLTANKKLLVLLSQLLKEYFK